MYDLRIKTYFMVFILVTKRTVFDPQHLNSCSMLSWGLRVCKTGVSFMF